MHELLAERLNAEPVIFRGYTDSELVVAIALCGGLAFPTGLLGGVLIGRVFVGLGAGMILTLGLVVLGASAFQAWKRGRPEFWLQQRATRLLADAGLIRPPLTRHRGVMSLGRGWGGRP
jgi:conjugative transfer region protein (TIGR03750 family)